MNIFVKNSLCRIISVFLLAVSALLFVLGFLDLMPKAGARFEQSDFSVQYIKSNLTDIPYSQVSKSCRLDIIAPKEHNALLPVIIYYHGGGWVGGTKEFYTDFCTRLADKGFLVVNVEYRLIPESPFPAFLKDAAAAFNWVDRYITRYGGDSANIFLCGDSAGAHISALCANALTNENFPAQYGIETAPLDNIRALGLLCGVYDMSLFDKNEYSGEMLDALLQNKNIEQAVERADDLTVAGNISESFPPCFITSCYYDIAMDQVEPMVSSLENLGIGYEALIYDQTHTDLGHCYQLYDYPESIQCVETMTEFFHSNCL